MLNNSCRNIVMGMVGTANTTLTRPPGRPIGSLNVRIFARGIVNGLVEKTMSMAKVPTTTWHVFFVQGKTKRAIKVTTAITMFLKIQRECGFSCDRKFTKPGKYLLIFFAIILVKPTILRSVLEATTMTAFLWNLSPRCATYLPFCCYAVA